MLLVRVNCWLFPDNFSQIIERLRSGSSNYFYGEGKFFVFVCAVIDQYIVYGFYEAEQREAGKVEQT